MTQKGELVQALLGERMKQRLENLTFNAEQRRAERGINIAETENADFFIDNFQIMKEKLEFKLNGATLVNEGEIIQYLDELVADVSKMQQFLNESSMFLPSFQIKKAQESINTLNESVQSSIVELQPKKKFGFRNKNVKETAVTKPQTLKSSSDSSDILATGVAVISEHFKEKSFFGFKNISGQTLQMSAYELKNRQFNLQYLENCKVIALGNPSSLQFANLKDTTVLVGPTSRSAFIKNCSNCNFVLACQQVRIHSCNNTCFYLHVTGAAIIEDCKEVCFGPYTLEYDEKDIHFGESGLSPAINNWDKVEDFHWLNEREKSPNFIFLEESVWKKDWLHEK